MARDIYPVTNTVRYGSELCPICGGNADTVASFDTRNGARGVICSPCLRKHGGQLPGDLRSVLPRKTRKAGIDQTDFFDLVPRHEPLA